LLHKDPVKSFEELTDNPAWREQIRKIYNNDIEAVDLMVGLYAEPLPDGFGFSETAFRIFILMASRRLKSDRFYTADFTPEIYTDFGINWVGCGYAYYRITVSGEQVFTPLLEHTADSSRHPNPIVRMAGVIDWRSLPHVEV